MTYNYRENFLSYLETLDGREWPFKSLKKTILEIKNEEYRRQINFDTEYYALSSESNKTALESYLKPTLMFFYYENDIYATIDYDEINVKYLFVRTPIPVFLMNYFVKKGEMIYRKNKKKYISLSSENIKFIFPTLKRRKLTSSWIWKFFNFFNYHFENNILPINIIIKQQTPNECAGNTIKNCITRLGYHLLNDVDYTSDNKNIDILKIFNRDNRIYIQKQILFVSSILIDDNYKTTFNVEDPDNQFKLPKKYTKDHLWQLFERFNSNSIYFDYIDGSFIRFLDQNFDRDVIIVFNVIPIKQSKDGHYIMMFFPRSPAEKVEIYDSLYTEINISKYQHIALIFKKMLLLYQQKFLSDKYNIHRINSWRKNDSLPKFILSYDYIKNIIEDDVNLLNCRINYDNFLLNHVLGYESYIRSNYNHIFMNQQLFSYLHLLSLNKKYHENIDEYGILNIPGFAKIYITSWIGAVNFFKQDIDFSNVKRVSLLNEKDKYNIQQIPETKAKYDDLIKKSNDFSIEILDNVDFTATPAISELSFINFFNTILELHSFFLNPDNILVVHCRSGIGRANLFVIVLLYYYKSFFLPYKIVYNPIIFKRDSFLAFKEIFETIQSVRPQIHVHKRSYPFLSYVIEMIYKYKYTNFFREKTQYQKI